MTQGNNRVEQTIYGGTLATLAEPDSVLLAGHDVPLGRYTTVRRLLPHRQRRMIGAWCFVDHFGPDDISNQPGMQIPPHPHTGLQTVTWLAEGHILHHDSLGNEQTIAPGQLNIMTSGHGIAHSEQSPSQHPPRIHGLQLWVALPEGHRHSSAQFQHYPTLPSQPYGNARITAIMGDFVGIHAPVQGYTPLVAAEIQFTQSGQIRLPLAPGFEYGVLAMSGQAEISTTKLSPGTLLYLGQGHRELTLTATHQTQLFVLGGEPFEEHLVMWWNFVERSHEEIVQARNDWAAGRRFGTVSGCDHPPLPAPAMPSVRLKPRDRHGHSPGTN